MLSGTANVETLAERAPVMDDLATESLALGGVDVLQLTYEVASAGAGDMLPPGLHPTIPPILTWLFFRCPGGPLGAFTMAQTRIGCRSGVRPRSYLLSSVIDNTEAGATLAARWGYRFQVGEVEVRWTYADITGTVAVDGRTILDVAVLDPEPLSGADVQYTANMNLARTPKGLRLVQVDPEFHVQRAERGKPRLVSFDAQAWGDDRLRPVYPVSASAAIADITLPRVRYLCKPDRFALDGTEVVG